MVIINQLDKRWSSRKLGASALTFGAFGCTTSCILMLASYFGELVNPIAFAANAAHYTKDGLILWNSIGLKSMKFVWRFKVNPGDAVIREALKNPNKGILLEVNNKHWVLALRPTFFGKDYVCADPWGGVKCDVLKKYGNITGAAIFEKK